MGHYESISSNYLQGSRVKSGEGSLALSDTRGLTARRQEDPSTDPITPRAPVLRPLPSRLYLFVQTPYSLTLPAPPAVHRQNNAP